MDRELLENEGAHERDDRNKPSDDQDVCGHGRESEAASSETREVVNDDTDGPSQGIDNLVAVLAITNEHFFPDFNAQLRKIPDPRVQSLITYKSEVLIWQSLLMLITRQGSRLKMSNPMRGENFRENLKQFSGQKELLKVPHGDTVEHLFRKLDVDVVEEFRAGLVSQLIRARVFESERLVVRNAKGGQDKYYMIAIDGVHMYSFDYKHCDKCLVKEDKTTGKKTWQHHKLQASLVSKSGFCIPLGSEWIENELAYNKQDCELKAFSRLLEKIRGDYPRLEICVLLDALYAGQPTFKALLAKGMEYIVVFKEGCMQEVWKWKIRMEKYPGVKKILEEEETRTIPTRRRRTHEGRLKRIKPQNEKREVIKTTLYEWSENFEHWDQQRMFNILSCREEKDGKVLCQYTWIISDGLNLCEDNVKQLAAAGRCRWVIENQGHNVQKNGGYGLEHQYSRDENSMKIWNIMLDIAHMISQLIEKGSLIIRKVYGTLRDLAQRLFEHLRYYVFVKTPTRPRIQIRFNSS